MTAMTAMKIAPELQLPWESTGDEDTRFSRILRNMLAAFIAFAIVIPFLPVQQLTREEQEQVPPQLARIILEKQALPEPVPVKPRPRPVQEKPEEKVAEKPPEKPKPVAPLKDKPKPKPVDRLDQARKAAAVAGVLAFQDDLLEMRDSMDLESMPQGQLSRGEASAAKVERSLITGAARSNSGGISTASLSRDTGGPALSGRETTRVESNIASTVKKAGQSQSAQLGGRSDESIRQVMDRHKGAIFAIYNRALRKDPLLEGKLVFEMLIDSSGTVAEVKLLSSELADEALTRKILSRIRMIRFEVQDVITTRVNYSFDFLPYS